jgi:pimeloyl-ACP methyl ester carboxylesterase
MVNRRLLLSLLSAAIVAPSGRALSQPASPVIKHARAKTLDIAYEESGSQNGIPVLLLHGFPYDPRCYDDMVPPLVAAGCRTIVPYLRGYGATRFLEPGTPRSGQQAAMGNDTIELMDALGLSRAAMVGFDWGGRAACVAAALWPERVQSLVLANGYSIQDIAGSVAPAPPQQENRLWYQYYFHTERGRAGLRANRYEFCKLLWHLWSPNWKFDEATYAKTAASFDNPDFVDIVIHSYRHRFGYAGGDPALEPIEKRLASRPPIAAPTIVLHGEGDGVGPPTASDPQARFFTGPYQRRLIPVIGHDVPQEAPKETAAAVLELVGARR